MGNTHVSLFTGIGVDNILMMPHNNAMKQIVTCNVCGKEFLSYNPNPTYCSNDCKSVAQSAGVPVIEAISLYESGMTQEEIGRRYGTTQKAIWGLFRRHGYVCRKPAKRDQWGDLNHAWKGDRVGYQGAHARVEHRKGKASAHICARCAEAIAKDWANLSGNYADPDDYAPMCRKCHRAYDRARRSICQSST